jgi:molybdopterin-guanine dinucleotide biosynthesis protein B
MITEFDVVRAPLLEEQLQFFDHSELDLILVEGFKAEEFPKIELHRPSLKQNLIFPNDPNIIAIASDEKITISTENTNLSTQQTTQLTLPPFLDLNNPSLIKDFILDRFLNHQ